MQQVSPTGLRLGSVTGGKDRVFRKGSSEATVQANIDPIVGRVVSRSGGVLLNHYNLPIHQQTFLRGVALSLFQRSRLSKGVVKRLNKNYGALATHNVRQLIVSNTRFTSNYAHHYQKRGRKRLVPRAGLKGYSPKAKRSWAMRGGMDLELKRFYAYRRHGLETQERHLRVKLTQYLGRLNARLHNIMRFVKMINTKRGMKHGSISRFSKMLYRDDLLRVVYLATQIHSAFMIAKVIQLGLERHAKKREQKYFVKLFRIVLERVTLGREVKERLHGIIQMSGKFDAKMRRTTLKVKGNTMPFQRIDFKVAYARLVSKTKFGTSSILVKIRNFD